MNYNKNLHKDLREVISSKPINSASDLNNLYQFLNDANLTDEPKLYINVEDALYEVESFDVQAMLGDNDTLNKVICIRAKKPSWISEYSNMDMDQLIEEYGKQTSRKAAAMYKKTDFKIVGDADDRMSYIQECLRELRFGKHDK